MGGGNGQDQHLLFAAGFALGGRWVGLVCEVGGLQGVQDHLISAPGQGHGRGHRRGARGEDLAHAIHHAVHAAQCLLQVGEVQVLLHDLLFVAHVLALLPFPDMGWDWMEMNIIGER